jgi:hypothetical protein
MDAETLISMQAARIAKLESLGPLIECLIQASKNLGAAEQGPSTPEEMRCQAALDAVHDSIKRILKGGA